MRRNPHIARALFWDALALLALSVYELCVRLDASWGWAKAYFESHIEAHTALSIILKHIPYQNVSVWCYMLACAALAVWALCSRRTRRVCGWLLVPCAALTALGFTMRLTIFGDLIRALKLLPLVFMLFLCLLHVIVPLPRPRPQQRPMHQAYRPDIAPQTAFPADRRRSERRKAS